MRRGDRLARTVRVIGPDDGDWLAQVSGPNQPEILGACLCHRVGIRLAPVPRADLYHPRVNDPRGIKDVQRADHIHQRGGRLMAQQFLCAQDSRQVDNGIGTDFRDHVAHRWRIGDVQGVDLPRGRRHFAGRIGVVPPAAQFV